MLRRLRVLLRRIRWGLDEGDRLPGFEQVHLQGRSLQKAVERGEVNPDGTTRTRRLDPPPSDPDRD